MVRLAIFGVVIVLLLLFSRAIFPAKKSSAEQEPTEMVMDPNNGIYIPKSEAIKKTVNGKEHYFSSEQSAEEYIKNK